MDIALIVAIIAAAGTITFGLVQLIGFLFKKRDEVNLAFRQIPSDVVSVDLNMREGFNRRTGAESDEPVTTERLIAAAEDEAIIRLILQENANGLYDRLLEIKAMHDKYRFWGRILRLGRAPKPLGFPRPAPVLDLDTLDKRLHELEDLNLAVEFKRVDDLAKMNAETLKHTAEESRDDSIQGVLVERVLELEVKGDRFEKLLEEQIGSLSDKLGTVSEGLIRVSRSYANSNATDYVNTLRTWLKRQNSDKARSCSDWVDRRYLVARTKIESSDSPLAELKGFRDEVDERLKLNEFKPFIEL